MKKFLLLFTLLVTSFSSINAQTTVIIGNQGTQFSAGGAVYTV